MHQQIGLVTLGISDLKRSKRFYIEGFGWKILHEDDKTAMYQMNGFILSTWLQSELERDITRFGLPRGGSITFAYIVDSPAKVHEYINNLSEYGGKILRIADSPPHGGFRGYIVDPDDHIWEIIYNSVWKINQQGAITFSP